MLTLNRTLAAFVLATLLVVFTGGWLGHEGGHILSLQEQQGVLSERIDAVRALQDIHTDIEIAFRGALMTGTTKALDQLHVSKQRWQLAVEKTRQSFSEDPADLAQLESLLRQTNAHFAGIEKALVEFRSGGALNDPGTLNEPPGRVYESLRSKVVEQRKILAEALEQQAQWVRYVSITTGLALLGLIGVAAYSLRAAATQTQALKEKLAREQIHDDLTGLANRRYLHAWLKAQISSASRMGDSFHVLYLDLDGFERINDQYGRNAGDSILIAAAQRLSDTTRGGDFVARQKDDEFVIVFSCEPDSREVGRYAARLIRSLKKPLVDGIPDGILSASIGVANYPADGGTVDDLVEAANKAMQQAKQAGKACYAYRRETAPNNAPHVWEVSRF